MPVAAQTQSAEPSAGTLVLSGGRRTLVPSILEPFLNAAGGADARIAYILIPRALPEATNTKTAFKPC